MNNAFKKMTRAIAWVATASLTLGFAMMPTGAAAYQSFPTPARYEFVSQNGTDNGVAHVVNANAGDTIAMSLILKNRQIDPAALVFYGKSELLPEVAPYRGAHELRLGVKNDVILPWIDASSFIANPDGASNRLAVYDGPKVNPGETLTFSFNLKIAAGTANGTYDLPIGVVREYDSWLKQVKNGKVLPSADIYWRVVVGGGSVTPATGGLSIALAGDTPASASIADGGQANFTKFTMTAAAGATVLVNQLYVKREGLSTSTQLENVKLLTAEGVQIGSTAGGFNADDRAQIFINPALSIIGTQTFYLRAGIVDATPAGVTFRLGIATNDAVISNATSVTGAPVFGNYMTCVLVAIGTLTVTEDGSIADTTPDVGDTNVILNTFKLTAGSVEGFIVDRITVLKSGSAETSDSTNIELWDVTNNKSLGEQTSWTADGKASWGINIVLGKGDTIRLRVQEDINDGVGLTTNCDLADGSDYLVFGKGTSYGFYVTPTGSWTADSGTGGTNNAGQGDKNQTINSGAVTITKSALTPPTGNVDIADNQLLGVFAFDVKGESVRISAVHVEATVADTSAGTPVATGLDLTNVRLVDMATGNILSGPVDGSADAADSDEELDFTNTFTLPVGVSNVGVKGRLGAASGTTGFEALDTIITSIDAAGNVSVKGIITNNTITPTVSSATSNTLTVKAGALDIATLGVPATGNVIVNAQDMIVGTYSFNAVASGEDITVSTFTVTDDMDATTGESDDFANWQLWADLTAGTTSSRGDVYETQISGTENPTSDAADSTDTQAFTLTTPLNIAKGTSVKVALVADVIAGATALGTHIFETTNGACATVTGKDTGTDVTESSSGLGINATLTIAAAGSLTTGVAASSPTSALMIAGASAGQTLAAFDFTATDEPYTITKLTLDMNAVGSGTGYESMASLTISYPTKTGTDSRTLDVNIAQTIFDNINMYVPKNGRATLTVSGITKKIGGGNGGTFGDKLLVEFDGTTASGFAATGENSGGALTVSSTGINDQAAEAFYIYNSIPTVTAANPSGSGTIQPGSVIDLYKFKVTADAAGPIAIKRFTFTVFITDASTTTASDADLATFTFLRDGTDISGSAMILDDTTPTAAITIEATNKIENNTSSIVEVIFGNTAITGEEVVAKGQTVTYTLRALCGTGFTTTDAISTSMNTDTAVQTANYYYLGDTDTDATDDTDVGLQTSGEQTATAYKFIWSDQSTLVHLSTFSETTSTSSSSGDWTQGFLVKNFPLSGYGYTL